MMHGDEFLTLHRNLIFKAIRHYADGYDDVMDVFAYVCESLRKHDLARIGPRALVAGALASFMTATIAGVLVG